MQKDTLDKLYRFFEATSSKCSARTLDGHIVLEEMKEKAWQEFVEANLVEERELRALLGMIMMQGVSGGQE